jgi:hypothetical protein
MDFLQPLFRFIGPVLYFVVIMYYSINFTLLYVKVLKLDLINSFLPTVITAVYRKFEISQHFHESRSAD